MRYRPFGKTGLQVSEVGYGAWGIGKALWVGAEDEESLRSLRAARDAGVNFFDTALAYGEGHSERLIAQCFADAKGIVIASKVPPKDRKWSVGPGAPLENTFPKKYVLDCLDQSLKNLNRDSIDVYQFHTWIDDWAGDPEWQETVREMKSSGKVKFVGISIQNHQPGNVLKALNTGFVDAVQVIYNIFDQSPEDQLFPYCQKNGIGVIVRVPFDEGSLTGRIGPETEFPEGDFRNIYFAGERKKEVWEHVQAIVRDLGIGIEQLPEIALRFCLSHPAVFTVIPGMRNAKHVAANAAASEAGPLPPEMLESLRRQRWVRNYYWT
jgi:aryl-alcohol dehydrogenase-like predicted oxidoreductase